MKHWSIEVDVINNFIKNKVENFSDAEVYHDGDDDFEGHLI